jgi:hypothetical protein|tara:strand:+ start:65 stop:517 length:453 start_codon:yes stop_codon:yes gene_type:complete
MTNQESINQIKELIAKGDMNEIAGQVAIDALTKAESSTVLKLSQTLKISAPMAVDAVKIKKGKGENGDVSYDGIKGGYLFIRHTNKENPKDGISAYFPLSAVLDLYTHKDRVLEMIIDKCDSGHLFAERNHRRVSQLTATDSTPIKALLG